MPGWFGHSDMSKTTALDEPLLDGRQAIWVLITLGWFGVSLFHFVDGKPLFGVAFLLLGVGSIYRIANPG